MKENIILGTIVVVALVLSAWAWCLTQERDYNLPDVKHEMTNCIVYYEKQLYESLQSKSPFEKHDTVICNEGEFTYYEWYIQPTQEEIDRARTIKEILEES